MSSALAQPAGDLGPTQLSYVPPGSSPTGTALLLMAAEYSGGAVLHEVVPCYSPSTAYDLTAYYNLSNVAEVGGTDRV